MGLYESTIGKLTGMFRDRPRPVGVPEVPGYLSEHEIVGHRITSVWQLDPPREYEDDDGRIYSFHIPYLQLDNQLAFGLQIVGFDGSRVEAIAVPAADLSTLSLRRADVHDQQIFEAPIRDIVASDIAPYIVVRLDNDFSVAYFIWGTYQWGFVSANADSPVTLEGDDEDCSSIRIVTSPSAETHHG